MKAREVSVMVAQFNGELYVNVTMKLKDVYLRKEASHPSGDMTKGVRVSESSRKQKSKEIQKILESVEFPND